LASSSVSSATIPSCANSPLNGSTYQDIHRDTPPLFDDLPETPSFQLAVNFPLCDVSLENGPFETTLGTHRMRPEDAMKAWNERRAPLHAITMELGDVMIRDVRALHRGTPNTTDVPRPMVVIGYSRSWYFRPEVHIDVPVDVDEHLSRRAKRLLRYMPRVDAACRNARRPARPGKLSEICLLNRPGRAAFARCASHLSVNAARLPRRAE
jgi:ectoine hydroxylase-related dioxygenase (phytanoyl-CoA dioxygenase family)